MNKLTIEQLKRLKESEDKVEFNPNRSLEISQS